MIHARLPHRLGQVLSERKLWRALPAPRRPAPGGPPRLALSFDLDYQADTDALPALCGMLEARGLRATLFSIGALVARDPDPYRAAAEAGHEIANHTQTHPDNPVLNPDREFWDLSEDEMTAEIATAQDVLERETGQRPTGFRSPHFKDAPPLLAALGRVPGLAYVSSSLATRCPVPVPYVPGDDAGRGRMMLCHPARDPGDRILMLPLTACPGVRWSPFSSYLSIRQPPNPAKGAGLHGVERFADLWRRMLTRDRGLGYVSVYFDPLDVMRDGETRAAFAGMLDHALSEGWRIEPLRDVAAAWDAPARAAA